MSDDKWMRMALAQAQRGARRGEVPVGAIVVLDGRVVGAGFNCPITSNDPTAHAEVVALRDAAFTLGNYRLLDCTLYVTLEPCGMCAGALVHARVKRVVYAASEPKAGVVDSRGHYFQSPWLNHQVISQSGVLATTAASQLSAFFKGRRAAKKTQASSK
ncbi:tRNA adenosine(34) deaminase TadA [Litorivicinus lipolyticus]|uniref:tRNA adenosine(34) deaminase TadA n=1 Tax=Litorivicinus lipolyticus TaxID=418701 RepID=UPI003B5AC166